MRRDDEDRASGTGDPMEFSHHGQRLVEVFDDVPGHDGVECVFIKWVGKRIQFVEDIRVGVSQSVDADRPVAFVPSTPNVEDSGAFGYVGLVLPFDHRDPAVAQQGA
ncbi:MAG TPA: hypothetical protein VFN75_03585 [Pseudonocardiaceae bacterium]|nr:hypothetical protein [Pseudonocardiaceae bacterium]